MKQHITLRTLAIFAALVATAHLITACAQTVNTRGQVILPSRLAQIQPGTTTRQDVIQLLGSPSMQGTLNDNRWYYVSSMVASTPLNPTNLQSRQVVIIDFDPKTDVVANLTQKDATDGKEITPEESTTPTHGQSLGIIDQFLGNLGGIVKKQ